MCPMACQLEEKAAEAHALRMANEEAVMQRQEQAIRRMLNLQLASGFGAWQALADERRKLMLATRTLRSPGLAFGWRSWLAAVQLSSLPALQCSSVWLAFVGEAT